MNGFITYALAGFVTIVVFFFFRWLIVHYEIIDFVFDFLGLIKIEWGRKGTQDKTPVQRVSIDGLREGGQVNWIDRKATNVGQLKAHGKLIITGRMKIGKSREAIELIRRAINEELIQPNNIIKPSPIFRIITPEIITQEKLANEAGIDPHKAVLLFLDDLPFDGSGQGLARLSALLQSLQRLCKRVFVIATARSEQLTNEHKRWLTTQKFHSVKLPDLDRDQTGRLVDSAAGVFKLQIGDTARNKLVEKRDGTPELILTQMRLLINREGASTVTEALADRVAKDSITEAWAEVKQYIEEIHPPAKFLFEALAAFYLARVPPFTGLVLGYAGSLWKEGNGSPNGKQSNQLRSALKYLNNFEIKIQNNIISHPDFTVEGIIGRVMTEKVTERLGEFLTNHHKVFRNPMLRRFYSQAEAHAWGLFALGLSEQEKNSSEHNEQAEQFYSIAIKWFPHYGIYHNLGVVLYNLGKFRQAEAAYRKAIELNPSYAAAHSSLGNTLKKMNRDDEAEGAYRKAIELNPSYATAYYNLGILLKKLKRNDDAEAAFREAKAVELNSSDATFNHKPHDEAKATPRKAIEPNHSEIIAYPIPFSEEATRFADEVVLALVFDRETPFSTTRMQVGQLVNRLSTETAEAMEKPVAGQNQPPASCEAPTEYTQYIQEDDANLDAPNITNMIDDVRPPKSDANWIPLASEEPWSTRPSASRPRAVSPESSPALRVNDLLIANHNYQTVGHVVQDFDTNMPSKSRPLTPVLTPAPGEPDATGPHSITEATGCIMMEPVSPGLYNLTYACLVVPRFTSHYLTGDISDRLFEWVPDICIAFGWRLEYLAVRPEYIQWVVTVPPSTSPGYLMRIMRPHTSEKIFAEFPRMKKENPSGDFWAPGYLITGGRQPHPPQLVKDYIRQTRDRQGTRKRGSKLEFVL